MTKEMNNEGGTLNEMKQTLASLREALWGGNPYAAAFDEFIREHEWGLALHAVCDYLLEPPTPPAAPELIEKIQSLHKEMEIKDSCVSDLRRKAGQLAKD